MNIRSARRYLGREVVAWKSAQLDGPFVSGRLLIPDQHTLLFQRIERPVRGTQNGGLFGPDELERIAPIKVGWPREPGARPFGDGPLIETYSESECDVCLDSITVEEYRDRVRVYLTRRIEFSANEPGAAPAMKLCERHRDEFDAIGRFD